MPFIADRRYVAAITLTVTLALTGCGSSDGPSTEEAQSSAVATLVATGIDQINADSRDLAAGTFQSVLTLEPENAFAHYNLGLIAQLNDDFEEAIRRYDDALKAAPELSSALYNRAILTEGSDLKQAVSFYERAVAADPGLARAHMRLGFALDHLGDSTAAEDHLATALQIDPSLADVEAPDYK